MKQNKIHGDAYQAVRYIYEKSPGRSWQRLNGALWKTLMAAITAKLSFKENDFGAMRADMNGDYWMGNSTGSICGEVFYGHAVESGHTPACISFEKYAGRPAALWPEKTKTPKRLRIGSEFTWEGLRVKVTNMKADHLIACAYGGTESPDWRRPLGIGDISNVEYEGYNPIYRPVEALTRLENGGLIIRFGKPVKERTEKPSRRFTIPYKSLLAKRKEFDARKKSVLKQLTEADTPEALTITLDHLSRLNRGDFRHFDIEEINAAVNERRESFKKREESAEQDRREAALLQRWLAGERVGSYFSTVRLRVVGDYVETTTGQSVSLESVRAVLPLVPKYRNRVGSVREINIDLHEVRRVGPSGVTVGCTTVPWAEIERLPQMISQL